MGNLKRSGLGRGLESLFSDAVPINQEENGLEKKQKEKTLKSETSQVLGDSVQYIEIHKIMPNENQPRKTFNKEKIEELSKSIIEHGIIQPIVVRTKGENYEIVAGERRWRAAMEAELEKVPCIVRELDDEQNMLLAIIENMQREDLNPIEEAEGLYQMISRFGMTQEEISKGVGKSRPYIANALRLLKLPDYIREMILDGLISAGHGRTLINIEKEEDRNGILKKIIDQQLSVRETEKLVNQLGKKKNRPAKRRKSSDVYKVEDDLKTVLGTRVSIKQNGRKGKIEIEFFNKDELERLVELLKTVN